MILRALTFWTDWFVVWVDLFSVTAYVLPELFMPLRSLIVPGLGVALAGSYSQSALVALPASLFSVVHNLTGSILANLWRRREEAPSPDEETGHPALHS